MAYQKRSDQRRTDHYKKPSIRSIRKNDHTYKFHVHYTDVAGMSLEGNLGSGSMSESGSSIVQEIDVTVPAGKQTASVAVYGIPKETVYTIHEENEIPQNIEIGGNYTYPQNVAKKFRADRS